MLPTTTPPFVPPISGTSPTTQEVASASATTAANIAATDSSNTTAAHPRSHITRPSWIPAHPDDVVGKSLMVGTETNLRDLENFIDANRNSGRKYLSCETGKGGTVLLRLSKSSSSRSTEAARGRAALRSILKNTCTQLIGEHAPHGKGMADALESSLWPLISGAFIGGAHVSLEKLKTAIELAKLDSHKSLAGELPPSTASPHEAGRMPSECLMHLIAALDAAIEPMPDGAKRAGLELLLQQAQRQFMQHKLSFPEAEDFFRLAEKGLKKYDELAVLARTFADEMKALQAMGAGQAEHLAAGLATDPHSSFHTRLADNIYGRAIDTLLQQEMAKRPPQNMKHAIAAVGRMLWKRIEAIPEHELRPFFAKLPEALDHHNPHWAQQSQSLRNLLTSQDGAEFIECLHTILHSTETANDCMTLAHVSMRMFHVARPDQEIGDWVEAGGDLYINEITPRKLNVQTEGNTDEAREQSIRERASTGFGLNLRHQPALDAVRNSPSTPHFQFVDMTNPLDITDPDIKKTHPDIEKRWGALRTALRQGLPYATGVSGSTNMVAYVAYAMHQQGHDIDPVDLLAAYGMYFRDEGGHSLHEEMHTMVHAAHRLGMPLGFTASSSGGAFDADSFVTDYQAVLRYLYRDEPPAVLKQVEQEMWRQAIAYYRQHSWYGVDASRLGDIGSARIADISGK